MAVRIVVAFVLFVSLALIAWWLERRRRQDAPTQPTAEPPAQLDRTDFPHPERAWLVALFTSSTCASCAGLYDKAAPMESSDVAVVEIEFTQHRALHDRYNIAIAPLTLVADHDGVVRTSFAGAFNAAELWNVVAELRQSE